MMASGDAVRTGFRLREAAGRGNQDEVLKQLSGAEACDVDDSGDVRLFFRSAGHDPNAAQLLASSLSSRPNADRRARVA